MEPTTTILPTYLQKYIIRIICEHIDRVNRKVTLTPTQEIRLQKINDENQVRSDIESFSLVNKSWFNTLSQFLTVSVDFIAYTFNFKYGNERLNQPTYDIDNIHSHFIVKRLNNQITTTSNGRLLKDENIKELVLNIQEWHIGFRSYDVSHLPLIQFIFEQLNQSIKSRFINLEKLIITINPIWFIHFQRIEFNCIKVLYYSASSKLKLTSLPTNIKEIENLDIFSDSNNDLECLQFFKSLNYVGALHSNNNVNFKYMYDNGVDCFQNTNKIIMECFLENITIQNVTYQIQLSPNISEYHIELCIDNLMYQLNDLDDTTDKKPHYKCSIGDPQNNNFKEQWKQFSESIINHKNLKKLTISHGCSYSPTEDDDFENEFHEAESFNTSLSTQLIDQLKLILSSNKSINELYLENIPNYSTTNNVLNNFK